MKKIGKAAVCLILAVCVLIGVAGCSEYDLAGEGTAYGVVGDYVGFITVRTASDGKITNVIIDEMQLPDSWAKASVFDDYDEGDFLPSGYAKQVVIGGKVFESVDKEAAGYPDYQLTEMNNGVSLIAFMKSGLNAKWYVEQMKQGNYGIGKAGGGVNNQFKKADDVSLGDLWLKSKNGYWPPEYGGKGWKANVEAMQEYIKNSGFVKEGMTLRGEDNIWTVNGTATGATINAFNEYIALARIAYSIATTQFSE